MTETTNDSIHAFYRAFGEKHWYLRGRYDIVRHMVEQLPLRTGARVLDVGCGGGTFLELLNARKLELFGSELSEDALHFARRLASVSFVSADMTAMPFRDCTFDLVVAIDVLEHISEHSQACKELYRVLRPGGYAILTVPAFMCLWGHHDGTYGHKRRYTIGGLAKELRAVSLDIRMISYMQFLLFAPMFVFRNVKNILKSTKDDFFYTVPWFDALLEKIISSEKYVLGRLPVPIGPNIICIVAKP
jgi:ubiquinone/menaquinone biosynthesis C-methylase UbiE